MRGYWLDATETEITTFLEVRLFLFIQYTASSQYSVIGNPSILRNYPFDRILTRQDVLLIDEQYPNTLKQINICEF